MSPTYGQHSGGDLWEHAGGIGEQFSSCIQENHMTERSVQHRGAVIFDGDDTLWSTQCLYDQAIDRFVAQMAHAGFDPQDVRNDFLATDLRNASHFGFSRDRFPQSMVQVYRAQCKSMGRGISPIF